MEINEVFELLDEFFEGKRPKETYKNQINVGGVEINIIGNSIKFNTGIRIVIIQGLYFLELNRGKSLFNFPKSPEFNKVSKESLLLYAPKRNLSYRSSDILTKEQARDIILKYLKELKFELLNFTLTEQMAFIENIDLIIEKK